MSEDVRQENTYWSREMADLLQIGGSTLRKWCGVFEAHGYSFLKDDKGKRAFTDHDAIALRHFKDLTMDKGVALDVAAKAVIERFGSGALRTIAVSATPEIERYAGAIDKLMQHIEHQDRFMQQQEQFNQELVKRLDDQQKYIESYIKDRMDHVDRTLRESTEQKQKKRRWFWQKKN